MLAKQDTADSVSSEAQLAVAAPACAILAATETLAAEGGHEVRGAIFTRSEVVDFILDLAGYTEDQPLHEKRLLEPSFGGGDFLLPIIERLLNAWQAQKPNGSALDDLPDAIRAVELHHNTFSATHAAVLALLQQHGIGTNAASVLARHWLSQGDFLLSPLEGDFDFVVGNPPYVRQELIPPPCLPRIAIVTRHCMTEPISIFPSSRGHYQFCRMAVGWVSSAPIAG